MSYAQAAAIVNRISSLANAGAFDVDNVEPMQVKTGDWCVWLFGYTYTDRIDCPEQVESVLRRHR